jgi:hypothetical protein
MDLPEEQKREMINYINTERSERELTVDRIKQSMTQPKAVTE